MMRRASGYQLSGMKFKQIHDGMVDYVQEVSGSEQSNRTSSDATVRGRLLAWLINM